MKKNSVQLSWYSTLFGCQLIIYIIKKRKKLHKNLGTWNLTELTTLTGKTKNKKIHKVDPTINKSNFKRSPMFGR